MTWLAETLLLASGLWFAREEQVDVHALRLELERSGVAHVRQVSDDPQVWAEILSDDGAVIILEGWHRISDETLAWLDKQRAQLQRGRRILFVISDQDVGRLQNSARHLRTIMSRVEAPVAPDPPFGLAAAAAVIAQSGVLGINPEDDAIVDALMKRRTAKWTTRPLTRPSDG